MSVENILNISNIDINGAISLLNPEYDPKSKKKGNSKLCCICNLHERRSKKQRCEKCPFIFDSASEAGSGSRVGMGADFEKYGFPQWWRSKNGGKCQFFWYLYHTESNWEYPILPEIDSLENINNFGKEDDDNNPKFKTFMWIIHHVNGLPWDDRFWNLLLMLNTEHTALHQEQDKLYKPWMNMQLNMEKGKGIPK